MNWLRVMVIDALLLGATSMVLAQSITGNASSPTWSGSSLDSQSPIQIAWTRQFGTPSYDDGAGVTADTAGNVYVTGDVYGNLAAPSAGGYDAFVAQYDTLGNQRWVRQLGTTGHDIGVTVAANGTNGVYAAGHSEGSLAGPGFGSFDAYLFKFDTAGNTVWSRQLGVPGFDYGRTCVDGQGNVWLAGSTEGSLAGPNAGNWDTFVAKYSADGQLLLKRQWGGPGFDYCRAVAADAGGNAYLTGTTSNGVFLLKYDSGGNLLWNRSVGGTSSDDIGFSSIALDKAGNVFVAGGTSSSIGGINAGGEDAFVCKFDPAGNLVWARQMGTVKGESANAIALDENGSVYVAGGTEGDLAGPSLGYGDIFVAKLDSSGNILGAMQFGTSEPDTATGLAIGPSGEVFVSGTTYGNLGGPSVGNRDVFLTELTPVPEPSAFALLTASALSLLAYAWRRRAGQL
jgi:hypothetical protein